MSSTLYDFCIIGAGSGGLSVVAAAAQFGEKVVLIESGKIGRPVGEMNVTGNLKDLFSQLELVGNDVYPYSSTLSPSLAFGGVDFSGA